jgi:hypothetical protein
MNIIPTEVSEEQAAALNGLANGVLLTQPLAINDEPVLYIGVKYEIVFLFVMTGFNTDGAAYYTKLGYYAWNSSKSSFNNTTPSVNYPAFDSDSVYLPSTVQLGSSGRRLTENIRYIKNNYYTKTEVNGLIPDTSTFALATDIPDVSGFTTMTAVEAKGYQTADQVNALITTALGAIGVAEEGSY